MWKRSFECLGLARRARQGCQVVRSHARGWLTLQLGSSASRWSNWPLRANQFVSHRDLRRNRQSFSRGRGEHFCPTLRKLCGSSSLLGQPRFEARLKSWHTCSFVFRREQDRVECLAGCSGWPRSSMVVSISPVWFSGHHRVLLMSLLLADVGGLSLPVVITRKSLAKMLSTVTDNPCVEFAVRFETRVVRNPQQTHTVQTMGIGWQVHPSIENSAFRAPTGHKTRNTCSRIGPSANSRSSKWRSTPNSMSPCLLPLRSEVERLSPVYRRGFPSTENCGPWSKPRSAIPNGNFMGNASQLESEDSTGQVTLHRTSSRRAARRIFCCGQTLHRCTSALHSEGDHSALKQGNGLILLVLVVLT